MYDKKPEYPSKGSLSLYDAPPYSAQSSCTSNTNDRPIQLSLFPKKTPSDRAANVNCANNSERKNSERVNFIETFKRDIFLKQLKGRNILLSFFLLSCCLTTLGQGSLPMEKGMAVATNYSGIGNAASEYTPQDSNGSVLGVFDIRDPQGAATPYSISNWNYASSGVLRHSSWTAKNLGELFGIAIQEDETTPNIFTTTTGMTPTLLNDLSPRVNGTGGEVYSIDGSTGVISVLAILPNTTYNFPDTTSSNNYNRYVGLGQVTYNYLDKVVYVSNVDNGQVYVIDALLGGVLDSFNHNLVVPDVKSSPFTDPRRMVFGLGFNSIENRLYYAVPTNTTYTENQVWSVGLNNDGSLNNSDKNLEFVVSATRNNVVSDISFSSDGEKLLLSEMSLGLDSIFIYRRAHFSKVLEYTGGQSGSWSQSLKYDIGLGASGFDGNNSAGGVDYGYNNYGSNTDTTNLDDAIVVSGDVLLIDVSGAIFGIQISEAGTPVSYYSPIPLLPSFTYPDDSYYIDIDDDILSGASDRYFLGDVEVFGSACPVHATTLDETICDGESVAVGSSVYTSTGSYVDSLSNVFGCDSIVTLNLTVNPIHATTLNETICDGESFAVGSSVYSITGTYIDSLSNVFGCDSIVTLNMTVNPIHATTLNETICDGDSFAVGSSIYTSTGSYVDSLSNVFGCDSIVTLILTVNPVHATTLNETICDGESFAVGSSIYTNTGTYIDSLSNTFGCDSIVTLNLTVNPVHATTLNETICDGESITVGSSVYTSTGTYIDSLNNVFGCDSIVTLNLTVNPIHATTLNETICDGESVAVGTSVYMSTGSYVDSLSNVFGCDSIVTLNLIVNPVHATTLNETICNGESVAVGTSVYTSTGTYIDSLNNVFGCDSIVTLNLIVNPIHATTLTETICNGESITVGSSVYTSTGSYIDSLSNVFGCDSIVTLNLTVNPIHATTLTETICNGESVAVGTSVYTSTGTYIDSLNNVFGCDSIVTLNLIVNPVHATTLNETICDGESVAVGTSVYTSTGTYIDSLNNVFGCDSIVTLNLIVNPVHATTLNETICDGESVAVGTSVYTSTGSYVDSLSNVFGCDSIVTLNLTVNPIHATTLNETICDGESVAVGSSVYSSTGTHIDSLSNTFGCDSIITLNLTVNPTDATTLNETICNGESFAVGSSIYTSTGSYVDSLSNVFGCDSIVTLNLTVNPVHATTLNEIICNGESVAVGTSVYTITGSYVDSLINVFGCDSIVTLNLTVNPVHATTLNETICNGESITVGSSVYTSTGTYIDSLSNVFGCDSIVTLNLTVNPVHATTLNEIICNGESVAVGTSVYTITGSYVDSLINVFGCDSIVTLNLTVNPIHATTLNETICEGESVAVGSSVYSSTGSYVDSLSNDFGCDSIVTLNLTVNPVHATTLNETICDGESVAIGTSVYTNTGTYIDSLSNVFGCDSIVTLNLTVNPVHATTLNEIICNGESVAVGTSVYTSTGSYVDSLSNDFGCDSIVTLNLTVNPVHATTLNETICDGESVAIGTSVYTNTGTYIDSLSNVFGCDSIVTLNLTVNPVHATTLNEIICNGESVTVGSSIYTSTGSYVDSLINVFGCDSIVTLTLTVNPVHATTLNEIICNGESVTVGSSIYTSTGSYVDSLINVFGCDSIVTLNLTVNPVHATTLNETICNGESVAIGTSVYTNTGTYIDSLSNVFGCDSIVTLNLTVNPIHATTLTETICNGESITVGSSVYTSTGSYVDSLINVFGCDSIVTLNLTVNPVHATTLNETICNGESVAVGTSVYTSTGTYIDSLSNVFGCDSIVTLNLTVNPIHATTLTETICNGESITVGSSVYTSTGSYIDSLSNVFGCDSIVTLNLTVNPTDATTLNETICNGESVAVGTSVYTSTGSYIDSLSNVFGCDSIVTLNLNVITQPSITISGIKQKICPGTELLLNASGANNFEWSTGEMTASISVIVMKDTTITLSATNGSSCKRDTIFTILTDNSACPCALKIRNVGALSSCDPVTNAYSVELQIEHENSSADSFLINDELFSYDNSPQTIQLKNLSSDGKLIDLIAIDAIDSSCSDTLFSAFTAPESCELKQIIDTVYLNIELADSTVNECLIDELQLPNGIGNAFICENGSLSNLNLGPAGCFEITINTREFKENDTLCIVHCDPTLPSICDTTIIVLKANVVICPELNIFSSNTTPCFGEEVVLSVDIDMAEFIEWSTGENNTEISIEPEVETTYFVDIIFLNGCSVRESITIRPKPETELSITSNREQVCRGKKVKLSASSMSSYAWSTGDTIASIEVFPQATTNYSLLGTDDNNCTFEASIGIEVVPNNLTLNIIPFSPTTCNQPVRIEAVTNADSIFWSTGESSAVVFMNPQETTTYNVEVSNYAGCTRSKDVVVRVECEPIETTEDTLYVEISEDRTRFCIPREFIDVVNQTQLLVCRQGREVIATGIAPNDPCIRLNTDLASFSITDTVCIELCDQSVCDRTVIVISKKETTIQIITDTIIVNLREDIFDYQFCLDSVIDIPRGNLTTAACALGLLDTLVFDSDSLCVSISLSNNILFNGDTICVEYCDIDQNLCDQTILILQPIDPRRSTRDTLYIDVLDNVTKYGFCVFSEELEQSVFDSLVIYDFGTVDAQILGDSNCIQLNLNPDIFPYGDTIQVKHCRDGLCDTTIAILLPFRPVTEELFVVVRDNLVETQICLTDEIQLFGSINSQITCKDGVESIIQSFDSDSCFTIEIENEDGLSLQDTLCVIHCDINICDTTYVILIPGNPPVAVNDTIILESTEAAVTIAVLQNDFDPEGDSIILRGIDVQPREGTASINFNGTITYELGSNFFADSFSYVICDQNDQGETPNHGCDTAWVYLELNIYPCDPPEAFSPNGDGLNEKFVIPCLKSASSSGSERRIDLSVYNRTGHQVYTNQNYYDEWDGTYLGDPLPDGTYYYVLSIIEEGEESTQGGYIVIHR